MHACILSLILLFLSERVTHIGIINNTDKVCMIFFTENKRGRGYSGASSSPGCRAKCLFAELMLLGNDVSNSRNLYMRCFPHRCLRSFCWFCRQNSTFSIVFIMQSGMVFSIFLQGKTFHKAKKLAKKRLLCLGHRE